MIKGTSKNILCDHCRKIMNGDFITIKGKKRVLHYHQACYEEVKKAK